MSCPRVDKLTRARPSFLHFPEMSVPRSIDRFRALCAACPRLYSVLVRMVLELVPFSDREILLTWPFAKNLGWSRTRLNWGHRCIFENERVLHLNLHHIGLVRLPNSIGRLTALTVLRCGDNKLTSLPESIGRLPALRELFCSYNQLTSLPASLKWCTSLKLVYCAINHLTTIPELPPKCTIVE